MRSRHSALAFLFMVVPAMCLMQGAGCRKATPPVMYYTLSPMAEHGASASPLFKKHAVSLGVGPVSLPEYLSTSKLVIRSSPHRLDRKEFHRWAGSLHSNIVRVLSEDFSVLMGVDQVLVYPWEGGRAPDFQVEIDIRALDAGPGDVLLLKAVWRLQPGSDAAPVMVRTSRITKQINRDDLEGVVSAVSQALADMCREITVALENSQVKKGEAD